MEIYCNRCNELFETKPSYINRGGGKYCSRSCADKAKIISKQFVCHGCAKVLHRPPSEQNKNNTYFCSVLCRNNWNGRVMPAGQDHPKWAGGAGSYRERARKAYGLKCNSLNCPIRASKINNPAQMYDVDHVDGNRLNNDLTNLQILCVWCHALKTRIDRDSSNGRT